MRAIRYTLVLLCVLLPPAVMAQQSQRPIYGRVRGNDHRDIVPRGFRVKVTLVDANTGRALGSQTFGELYAMSVDNNRVIDLIFQSDGYEVITVPRINTGTDRGSYLVPPTPVTLSRIYGRNLTRSQVGERLRRERVIAKITGAVDLFLYNLESYKQVYRDSPDVLAEIEGFKTETKANEEFRELLTPERESQMNSFGKVIQFRSRTISAVDPAQVLDLIKDESVFPGIRAQAVQAFTAIEDRSPEVTTQALEFFRQQAAAGAGDLLLSSYTALASIGTEADIATVTGSVRNADFERAAAAITAIGEAEQTRGSAAVAALLRSETDPSLRLVAISSLRRLTVRQKDAVATAALQVALGGDFDAAARAEAAEGLAGARFSGATRAALMEAILKDESFDVRVTAAGAHAVSMNAATITTSRQR